MIFKYQPVTGFDYMKEFANRFKIPYTGNSLEFNSSLGNGFMKTININADFRIVLNKINYKAALTIKKKATDFTDDFLIFRFIYVTASDRSYLSNVQVMNNIVATEDIFDANTNVYYVVISIKASELLNFLDLDQEMEELASFISNFKTPFLYQEIVTLEMKNIIREIFEHTSQTKLEKFYYKIKASELIYEFFSRFLRRTTFDFGSINKGDIEKVLRLEKIILKDLSNTPVLSDLAHTIGMSETKMKLLFKKVFEDSIYNYYSSARMIEAASILKSNNNISVSEVGYSFHL